MINAFPKYSLYQFINLFILLFIAIFFCQIFLSGINLEGDFLEIIHEDITEIMALEKTLFFYAYQNYRILTSLLIHDNIV